MINREAHVRSQRSSGAVRLKAAVAQLNANSQMDLIKQKEAFLHQQGTEIWGPWDFLKTQRWCTKGKFMLLESTEALKPQLSCCFESWNYRVPTGAPWWGHIQCEPTVVCTQTALPPIYLTAGAEPLITHRSFVTDSRAASSAWDWVYALAGPNKTIFLSQPLPGRSALDADQQLSFTWMTWNNPDSFKAEQKNVPSMSRGRPQRFVYGSYGWCIPLRIWFSCLNSEQRAVSLHQSTFLQLHQHIREQY